MLGRAFHYGLGAFGAKGAAHVVDILRADLISNMGSDGGAAIGRCKTKRLDLVKTLHKPYNRLKRWQSLTVQQQNPQGATCLTSTKF